MHFASFVAAVAAFAPLALAKPASGHSHAHHVASAQLQKRADEVITAGAVGLGDGKVHARLEINDVARNRPAMWSLYIRTLQRWRQTDDDDTSYHGVSSIHGVPHQDWNNVRLCEGCEGANGYCTHDSVHFPAWHRTYQALFEQELIKRAVQLANEFDGDFGNRLKAAAQKLRAPYWDFAADPDPGQHVLPAYIADPQVTIIGPNGDETVDNPLFSYNFANPSTLDFTPFVSWPNTIRYPNTDEPAATSQTSRVVEAFDNLQPNMKEQVYQVLTQCKDYLGFATTGSTTCATSLETIHNTIHTCAGGPGNNGVSGGHMTYLPIASFDPLFWLVHGAVDRLFALWQTANPEQYGASQVAPHNTWSIRAGSTQDANSPLMPFRKASGVFWNTNEIKDFEAIFMYSYPEFVIGDQSQATIINYINAIYSPTSTETASSLSARAERDDGAQSGSPGQRRALSLSPYGGDSKASGSDSGSSSGGAGIGIGIGSFSLSIGLPWSKPTESTSAAYPTMTRAWNGTKTSSCATPTGTGRPSITKPKIDPAFIAPNGSTYHYQCNINTPRYAFDGSYVVYVFDGQPAADDPSTWLGDENCIGQMGILAGGMAGMAGNHSMTSGSIPVTHYLRKLYKAGKISGLSEDVVLPYMTQHLNWRIAFRGQEVHLDSVKGYKASFMSGLLSPHAAGELPSWSNLRPHVDVTKEKAGGITEIVQEIFIGVIDTHPSEPATTPSPELSVPIPHPNEEDEVVTVYTTEYVTYCPCKESESTTTTSTTTERPAATESAISY